MKLFSHCSCVVLVILALVASRGMAQGEDDFAADAASTDDYASSSPVTLLTDVSFKGAVESAGVALVEFYAPWCGHCQELKPKFESAAMMVKEQGLKAALFAVDATKAEKLAKTFDVQGFPTLMFFKDGKKLKDYEGARDVESIVSAVEALTLPPSLPLSSIDEVDKFIAKAHKVSVLAHFTSPENDSAQKAFREAAAVLREKGMGHIKLGEITDSAVAAHFKMSSTPVVRLTRKLGEGKPVVKEFDFFTDKGFDTEQISEWFKAEAFPSLIEISPEVYPFYESRGLPFLWCFLPGHGTEAPFGEGEAKKNTPEIEAQNELYRKEIAAVGDEWKHKISVVWLSGEDYEEHAQSLGISSGKYPTLALTLPQSNQKFIYQGDVTAVAVRAFLEDWEAGKIEPTLKSEDVPVTQDEDVHTLVAKTLDSDLWQSTSDVFVEFYAPWCGHCQSLEPTWVAIAKELKDVDGITIAKIDATANDVPSAIEGFPTLYFKKAANKAQDIDPEMVYQGGNTYADLVSFIRTHSSAKLPESFGSNPPAGAAASGTGADGGLGQFDHEQLLAYLETLEGGTARDELKKLITEHRELTDTDFTEDDFARQQTEAAEGQGEGEGEGHEHDEL